ncbi:MAG: endonuclease/exonuclease/phosphatase family protein [Polyangiaceae bacterium]
MGALVGLGACAKDATTAEDDAGANGGSGAGGSGGSSQGGTAQGGAAGGTAKVPTAVRIGTFNVRNLFNDKIDGESWILDEPQSTPTTAEYLVKLGATASIVSRLDADVVMLQEVENREVLDDLAERPEIGRDYPYRHLLPGNDPRGIDIGLLSSLPIESRASHVDDYFGRTDVANGPQYKYARDCVEIHLRVAGRSLILLGVHFKAKSNDDPDKRLAEAQHTRFIADVLAEKDPEAAIVILGDFNDFPGSPPMDAIDGAPRFESTGRRLPAGDAWSVFSSSTNTGVALHDDVVANPLLGSYYVQDTASILHDDQLPQNLADVSDHAPVVGTFLIQPLL